MGEGIPWRVWVSDKHTTLIPLGPFPDISTTINSHQASRCCVHLLRFLRFPAFPAFFAFLFTRNGYARCKYLPSIYLSSLLFLPHISAILNDTSFNPRPLDYDTYAGLCPSSDGYTNPIMWVEGNRRRYL